MRPKRMFRIGVLLIVAPPLLSGQSLPDITAHLSLEKQQYLVGEPIFVTFSATYTGKKEYEELKCFGAYGQCRDYRVAVAIGKPEAEPNLTHPCRAQLEDIDCLIGSLTLRPGEEKKERVLLNALQSFHDPGTHSVTVTRDLTYFQAEEGRPSGEATATFTFVLSAPKTQDQLGEILAPYQRNLWSKDSDLRDEAALVISTLPTPFLEPDLIEMLKHDDLEFKAVHGLRRLNSEKGRAALLALLKPGAELSFHQHLALDALREMGDANTGAQLREFADKISKADDSEQILRTAAHLDPQGTLPLIDRMLNSADEHRRQQAVWLLEETGVREAATRLVSLLKDSSSTIRDSAERSLASLAQEAPPGNSDYFLVIQPHPDADFPFWQSWLAQNQQWPTPHMRECAKTNSAQ